MNNPISRTVQNNTAQEKPSNWDIFCASINDQRIAPVGAMTGLMGFGIAAYIFRQSQPDDKNYTSVFSKQCLAHPRTKWLTFGGVLAGMALPVVTNFFNIKKELKSKETAEKNS